jgi:hypothetical protein
MMNDTVRKFLRNKSMTVCLDDVRVYNHTIKEYLDHLRLVFQRSKENALLKLRLKKCLFGIQEMECLGCNVPAGKIFVSTKKV